MLRGECFRLPEWGGESPEGGRVLRRVTMLDPGRMQHVVQDGELVGWRYVGGYGEPVATQVFLPEEVWFERLANPFDCWRGLSPLSAAAVAAGADYAAGLVQRSVMENNGEGRVVVTTAEPLDREQREQVVEALRDRKRGGGVLRTSLCATRMGLRRSTGYRGCGRAGGRCDG